MKTPALYPSFLTPPTSYLSEEFTLRPLRTTHVELDYTALMDSKEMLRRWNGSKWPTDDFDLGANLADLAEHQQEHDAGIAYTFTMLNPSEDECLGCVYFETLFRYLELDRDAVRYSEFPSVDYEAVVRFWVKQPRLSDNLDRRLFQAIQAWIKQEWHFNRVFFRINSRDDRQVALVEEAELNLHYTLNLQGRLGNFLLYGVIGPHTAAAN